MTDNGKILMPCTAAEIYTDEGCFITELLNTETEPAVSVARARVASGMTTTRHVLSVDERYIIESGSGVMRLGDHQPFPVSAGQAVMIPAGTAQQIASTGPGDLVFLCVCTPRFTPDCYRDSEAASVLSPTDK